MNKMKWMGVALALLVSSTCVTAAEVEVVSEGLYNP